MVLLMVSKLVSAPHPLMPAFQHELLGFTAAGEESEENYALASQGLCREVAAPLLLTFHWPEDVNCQT